MGWTRRPRSARLSPDFSVVGGGGTRRLPPRASPCGHVSGARFDYVFHGSSGSTAAELRAAIDHGVVKVNLDTDAQYAFTRAVAGHVLDHWDGVLSVDGSLGDKRAYDPRAWGRAAEAAMARRVTEAAEQFGAAGRSIAGSIPYAPKRTRTSTH
jgi:Fructose-bisphosphate aldolase class-II